MNIQEVSSVICRNFRRNALLLGVLLCAAPFFAQDSARVDTGMLDGARKEAYTEDTSYVPWRNFSTGKQIRDMGRRLGAEIRYQAEVNGAAYPYASGAPDYKYRAARVFPTAGGAAGADVLYVNRNARVGTLKNLSRIISGYVERAYGVPMETADRIALQVCYWNTNHYNDRAFFRARFSPRVSEVFANRTRSLGLARSYRDWAGQTRIVIPFVLVQAEAPEAVEPVAAEPEVIEPASSEPVAPAAEEPAAEGPAAEEFPAPLPLEPAPEAPQENPPAPEQAPAPAALEVPAEPEVLPVQEEPEPEPELPLEPEGEAVVPVEPEPAVEPASAAPAVAEPVPEPQAAPVAPEPVPLPAAEPAPAPQYASPSAPAARGEAPRIIVRARRTYDDRLGRYLFLMLSLLFLLTLIPCIALAVRSRRALREKETLSVPLRQFRDYDGRYRWYSGLCVAGVAAIAGCVAGVWLAPGFWWQLLCFSAAVGLCLGVDVYSLHIRSLCESKRQEIEDVAAALLKDDYVDVAARYGVNVARGGAVLVQHEDIEGVAEERQQLVLGIALPLVERSELAVFSQRSSLFLLNTARICAAAGRRLSPEQKDALARRVSADYGVHRLDRLDWALAAAGGFICSVVDLFFTGRSGSLSLWSDRQTDRVLLAFATWCGWNPDKRHEQNAASAIAFLERKFKAPSGSTAAADLRLADTLDAAARDAHVRALSRSPDVAGLVCAVIDQFAHPTTRFADGKLVAVENQDGRLILRGKNPAAKVYCGFANWLGYVMDALAAGGAAAARTSGAEGVAAPFAELLQFCNFAVLNIAEEQKTIAGLGTALFERGYDSGASASASIPVLLGDCMMQLFWILKEHYYHRKEWKHIPAEREHPELQKMLLAEYGSMCGVSFADSLLREQGRLDRELFLRLDMAAWARLGRQGFLSVKGGMRGQASDPDAVLREIQRLAGEPA